MNTNDLLINKIIDKLIEASDKSQGLTLSVEMVHELGADQHKHSYLKRG